MTIEMTLLTGVLLPIVTTSVTLWVGLTSFYRQRWWEEKRISYRMTLEALAVMKTYTAGWVDYLECPDETFDLETGKMVRNEWLNAKTKIDVMLASDVLLISERSINQLTSMKRTFAEAARSRDSEVEAKENFDAIRCCIATIKNEAKRDLKSRWL